MMKSSLVLYGKVQGSINRHGNIKDAYNGLKEVKNDDLESGIKDIYYFMYEIETDKEIIRRKIKIYKQGDKILHKWQGRFKTIKKSRRNN